MFYTAMFIEDLYLRRCDALGIPEARRHWGTVSTTASYDDAMRGV